MTTLERILEAKIVAIIRGARLADVVSIAQALYEGGIRVVEVTMNSDEPLTAIAELVRVMGDKMLVGAGTVMDKDMAKAAIEAGAKIIISPSLNIETIHLTKKMGAVSIPGAFTATEIVTAYKEGADIVKLFPASVGVQYFADLRGPLPHIPLMPTGGVNLDNIKAFQKAGAVAFGIGSALVNTKVEVTETYLSELTVLAGKFVEAVR